MKVLILYTTKKIFNNKNYRSPFKYFMVKVCDLDKLVFFMSVITM